MSTDAISDKFVKSPCEGRRRSISFCSLARQSDAGCETGDVMGGFERRHRFGESEKKTSRDGLTGADNCGYHVKPDSTGVHGEQRACSQERQWIPWES
jgi:hypothetical protein